MKLKKPLTLLLISVLIIHLADFIIIPILPIFLKIDKNLSPSEIGFLIGSGSLAFQIGSITGGIISDKKGRKIILLLGAIIETIALVGLGLSDTYPFLIIFQILNGIGGGVFAPTVKAAISEYSQNKEITNAFSLRGIFANLGVAIGGLIPLILYKLKFSTFFFIASIFYILLFFIAIFIPNDKNNNHTTIKHYLEVVKDREFLIFNFITLLVWSIYIQLRLLLPLRVTAILENVKYVGTIWTLTSLFLVVTQNFITKNIINKINYFISIILGVSFMGIALFSIGISNSYLFLLLSAFIFIIGEMLIAPPIDSITSKLAKESIKGTYFSFNNISYGLGSSIGSFTGGLLIEYFGITNITPWIILLIISIIISLIILFMKKYIKIIRT